MRVAVIKDNTVTNIIMADPSVFAELEAALGATLVSVDEKECGIGWMTEDGGASFIAPGADG